MIDPRYTSKCNIDHSLINNKFCHICGEKISTVQYWQCSQNHRVEINKKFCTQCGSQKQNLNKPLQPSMPTNISSSLVGNSSFTFNSSITANKKSEMNVKIVWLATGLTLFFIVAIAIFSSSQRVTSQTINVQMTLIDQQCFDISWGYSDIPGGQVVVTVDGSKTFFGSYGLIGMQTPLGCKFTASIMDVIGNGSTYQVAMASGRRGNIFKSRAELESNNWNFELSLG